MKNELGLYCIWKEKHNKKYIYKRHLFSLTRLFVKFEKIRMQKALFMLHQVSIPSVSRQVYIYKNTNVASNTRVVKQNLDMVTKSFGALLYYTYSTWLTYKTQMIVP